MQIHPFFQRNSLHFFQENQPKASAHLSRYFLFGKFLAPFVLLFIHLKTISAQPSVSVVKMPPAHFPRPQDVDIQHVALDLRFDFDKKQAIGTADITLLPIAETDKIALDAAFLTIHSIKKKDGTMLKFENEGGDKNNNLKIALDRKYGPGKAIEFRVDYHTNYVNESDPNNLWGSFGKGLRFFQPTSTEPRKRRQIWSVGEPEGNRYWYPCHDDPTDFLTTELTATVDQNLTFISNGRMVSKKENSDGTHTFHWKMGTPHANHRTSFVVGEYVDFQQNWDEVGLHSFGYPDERAATEASVERLPEMIRFFSEIMDMKYPYPAYSQVFVQDFPWGGGHNAGLSTISENMIDDFGTHADFFYLWDGVEAQDLAAQWFGNLLTPADWADSWLSNSFAFYFDCLYSEHKNGHDEMLMWNHTFQLSTYAADWAAGIRRPIVTPNFDEPATMVFDNFALRGALVLHLLRKHLGEEKWRKAIQFYVKKHAGKTVTTSDFQQAVEAVSGEPMDWFFDQWLFKMGHPAFEVSKNYDPATQTLTLFVRQTQQNDQHNDYPQAGFFQGKMEVEIDGRIEQIWLAPRAENMFNFKVPTAPKWVNFDFESTWIKELKYEKSLNELLFQLQNSRDILARRSAIIELSAIFKKETTAKKDKKRIISALQTVVLGDSYWRLRNSAMLSLQSLEAGKPFEKATTEMLVKIIETEKSWLRAAAITFLGEARDPKNALIFIKYLADESDRVVNAAANALGKSKAKGAFEVLVKLKDKPSWKNQSLISSLNGLRELGDPRGATLALESLADKNAGPRWNLATSTWDFRLAAAETLASLGRGGEGYSIVYQRFMNSISENDVNDIFSNVLLLVMLGDARGLEVFPILKEKFATDVNAMKAVEGFEAQLREAMK